VDDFVEQELLRTKDEDVAMFEGGLWRYAPGFAQHFFCKYCVITKSVFAYFQSKWKAYNGTALPLVAIALEDIKEVQRVEVVVPEEKQIMSQLINPKSQVKPPRTFPKYQMEIFLKEGATATVNGDADEDKDEPAENHSDDEPEVDMDDERTPTKPVEEVSSNLIIRRQTRCRPKSRW
jgi:hypothetical protein